ncbi:MAG: acyl-CoA thioesterase [Deltaproteobacteria bacterium]|nr:acyl-CoA thioesterase [Deltaproteobacteria bacterium]
MRPQPFEPEPLAGDERFVRDGVGGLVWHRVFSRVLYADTDRSGVVYHANYLRYFELGRASLMRDVGYPYATVERNGHVYPIVDLGITFAWPLHYDDGLWVHTRPAELHKVRVTFDYLISAAADGKTICKGFTRHCALNRNGRPVAVDPLTVSMWESFPR